LDIFQQELVHPFYLNKTTSLEESVEELNQSILEVKKKLQSLVILCTFNLQGGDTIL